jgi:hypothetical protein
LLLCITERAKELGMAKSTKIRVMISSRCETEIKFNGRPQRLSVVRHALKKELEDFKLPNQRQALFECWINEDGTSGAGGSNWWNHCLKQAADADFVIVLYTGAAGGGLAGSDIGICHAELERAMYAAADRIRVIKLPDAPTATDSLQKKRDANFRNYFSTLDPFRASAKTGEEVLQKAWNEVQQAIVELVQIGSGSFRLSQASTGQALDWKRLSYVDRKRAMEEAMMDSLSGQDAAIKLPSGVAVKIKGAEIFLRPHASPASLSESTAREMVGQPFLADHTLHTELKKAKAVGPIHLVACPKAVTETQALKMLGFPDATIVSDSFGIHIADNIQKIQIALLKECVSGTAIRRQLAEWFEFLRRTGEDRFVLSRAQSRFQIIEAVAKEIK